LIFERFENINDHLISVKRFNIKNAGPRLKVQG
jgi:hypothetical protein